MPIDFTNVACQTRSNSRIFGLIDNLNPPHSPAYIDENDGANWIATVNNHHEHDVCFTAADHCIIETTELSGVDRCDGFLTYNQTVVFVELKSRSQLGTEWIRKGEDQLRSTIALFEQTELARNYRYKKAYIANDAHPKAKTNQTARINAFEIDTSYILRIQNYIDLE